MKKDMAAAFIKVLVRGVKRGRESRKGSPDLERLKETRFFFKVWELRELGALAALRVGLYAYLNRARVSEVKKKS